MEKLQTGRNETGFFRVEAGWAFSVDCDTYHILKKGNERNSPLAPIGLLVSQMYSMKENSKLLDQYKHILNIAEPHTCASQKGSHSR